MVRIFKERYYMRKFYSTLSCATAIALLTGCASEPQPGTATVAGGTIIGAGTGAAIGALAGGDSTAAGIGALAGAAAGALAGVAINESTSRGTAYPVAERSKNNSNYVISPYDGSLLFVGDAATGTRMRDREGRYFIVGDSTLPVVKRLANDRRYVINPYNGKRYFVGEMESGTRVRDESGRIFIVE